MSFLWTAAMIAYRSTHDLPDKATQPPENRCCQPERFGRLPATADFKSVKNTQLHRSPLNSSSLQSRRVPNPKLPADIPSP